MSLQDFTFSIVVTAKNEDAARETFKTYLKEERNIFNTFDFKVVKRDNNTHNFKIIKEEDQK